MIDGSALRRQPLQDTLPLVGIVVVNYNCAADTATCLRSLSSLEYSNYFVVVVDNASTDADTAVLGPLVRSLGHVFIRSPENCGFAGANNIGMQYAIASEARYAWLLNPDTVVDRRALTAFVETAEKEAGTIFGGKILYGSLDSDDALAHAQSGASPGERIWSAGGKIDLAAREIGMYGNGETDDGRFDAARECDYLPGCSIFLPLEAVERAGYMPEDFFMYFEETEWCARMKSAGLALKYLPGSVVWHRFDEKKLQGPRTVYYYNRNELAFWYRRSGPVEKLRTIWRIVGKKLPELRRAAAEAPDDELRNVFTAHTRACRDFLLGRMGRERA